MGTDLPEGRQAPSKAYMRLVRLFPLAPIRDDAQVLEASQMLGYVLSLGEEDPGVVDYLDVLTSLVEAYEKRDPIPDGTPVGALAMLMEQRGLTQAQLSKETRIAQAALTGFLHGEKALSEGQAGRLGEYFGVDASVFRSLPPRTVRKSAASNRPNS